MGRAHYSQTPGGARNAEDMNTSQVAEEHVRLIRDDVLGQSIF